MLTHYIFVRRDLPLGVLAAMVTHAAGESASCYEDNYDGRFRGATAVVLEARDEAHLHTIEAHLQAIEVVSYVAVHEVGGPYNGQLMSLGVVPIERELVAADFRPYQTLKSCKPVDKGGPDDYPT